MSQKRAEAPEWTPFLLLKNKKPPGPHRSRRLKPSIEVNAKLSGTSLRRHPHRNQRQLTKLQQWRIEMFRHR